MELIVSHWIRTIGYVWGFGWLLLGINLAQATEIYPVVRVNDEYITNFDIQQKIKLLQFNNGMSNLTGKVDPHIAKQVLDNYILERLLLQQLKKQDAKFPQQEVDQMVSVIEKQNHLNRGDLFKTLAYHGIGRQYFIDQLVAGGVWQSWINGFVSEQVRSISEQEIEEYYLAEHPTPSWLYHIKIVAFPEELKTRVEELLSKDPQLTAERLRYLLAETYDPELITIYDRGWRPADFLVQQQWNDLLIDAKVTQLRHRQIDCDATACQLVYLQQTKLAITPQEKEQLVAKAINPIANSLQSAYRILLERNNYIEFLSTEYR